MKTITTLFIFIMSQSFAANFHNKYTDTYLPGGHTRIINISDTLVFDLSNATLTATYIDIPVYILSDDTVNALDFSLKFNETKLTYDSLLNSNPDLSALAHYNTADHFLRLTSNSLVRMANNTTLMSIRFLTSSSAISLSNTDFDSITVYLNGDPCSHKIKGVAVSTIGINEINNDNLFRVYPNPASGYLHILSSENGIAQLLDITGRQLFLQTNVFANTDKEISLSNIENGTYLMKIINKDVVLVKKVVINK